MNRGTCSKNDTVVKWRIIVTWSIVRVFREIFKKNLKPRKPWKNLKLILNSLNIILMTLFVTGALFVLVV